MKKPAAEKSAAKKSAAITGDYTGNIGELLESARRTSALPGDR